MVVLDTSAVIDVVDGTLRGNEIREKYREEEIVVTTITINEALANTKDKEHTAFLNFFKLSKVLSFDSKAAYESARIEQELRKKGAMIGKLDLFIASICKAYDYLLVTLDNDFKRVEGLKVTVI